MQIAILARARLLRPTLLMVCVSVVLVAALLGIVGWALYDTRQQVWRQAEQATGNLALSLERDIARTIEGLDLSLRAAAQGMRVPGLAAMAPSVRQAVLFDGSAAAEDVGGMFVTDENGQVVYNSRKPEARALSLAHRSYFQAHRERADLGLVVSEPIRSLSDGAWTIALARRLDHPDGTFAGVVVAGLRLSYFDELFHALALGKHGAVTLFSTEKRVVARRPYTEQDIGRDASGADIFRHLAQAPSGSFEATAVLDGVQRLYSYRQVGTLPLVLNVGLATRDIYAEWTEKSAILGGVLFLALLGAGLAWTLRRELGRRGRAEGMVSRAARELEASLARLDALFRNSTDAMFIAGVEANGGFTYESVNPVWEEMAGLPAASALGRNPQACWPSEVADAALAAWRECVRERRPVHYTYALNRSGQQRSDWDVLVAPVLDEEGRVCRLIGSARDVTERSQLEAERERHGRELERSNAELERLARHLARARDEAERASRAKSSFLAGMSHELRTPLNGILGYAHLLRLEGGLNAVQSARVDAMLGAGTHLLEMINRVLDLSEVEAERVELRASTVDPDQVACACLDLVRPAAEAKGLVLSLDAAPDTPRRLTTDPTRLRQVLLNLLGNAVKFTAHGEIELRLRPAAKRTALRIEVADTGPGIPAEQRHRLFQDFERLGADATAVEGAGLGLALSARFVTLLGGRLGYEDNPGGGSVFWLELPLVASAVAAATEVRPQEQGSSRVAHTAPRLFGLPAGQDARDAGQTGPVVGASCPAGVPDARSTPTPVRPLRVLVVDDTAMNRDIAGSLLRAAGCTVVCAEGGVEAVTAAEAGDFDVILMDVRMPEIDGLEATRRVRALSGPRGRVPIVALTAQAFAEQVAECRAAGMDDHLAKPFAPDALLAAVTQAAAVAPERTAAGAAAETAPAPGTKALGSGTAVLDASVFQRTAVLLAPETVASHLRTIAGRSETLLRGLRTPDAPTCAAGDLAAAAHALGGSAGMFGFEHLASAARRFEFATETGASDTQALADELAAAIEASLPELLSRARIAAAACRAESGGVTADLGLAGLGPDLATMTGV